MNIKFEAYSSFGIPFKVEDDKYIWNFPNEAPSQEAIDAKIAELEKTQYQRDRAEQYPSITDVVVALAEKEEGNDAMWQEITALRQKVKADNPKPK